MILIGVWPRYKLWQLTPVNSKFFKNQFSCLLKHQIWIFHCHLWSVQRLFKTQPRQHYIIHFYLHCRPGYVLICINYEIHATWLMNYEWHKPRDSISGFTTIASERVNTSLDQFFCETLMNFIDHRMLGLTYELGQWIFIGNANSLADSTSSKSHLALVSCLSNKASDWQISGDGQGWLLCRQIKGLWIKKHVF